MPLRPLPLKIFVGTVFCVTAVCVSNPSLALEHAIGSDYEIKAPAKVLDSQEIDLGNRKITFNRIQTPVLKPQPTPVAVPQEVREVVPSAGELAEMRHWESLRYEDFGGSATVLEGAGTLFRIWTPQGEVVARSSLDFNVLRSLWDFEWAGTYYSVFFFAESLPPEEFAAAAQSDPGWAAPFDNFPAEVDGESRFTVVSAPKGEGVEGALRALEDLHAFFDENRKQLRATYEEDEKVRIAREEWAKAHPPVARDTVVNFFPIRSVYAPKTAPVKERPGK